MNFLLITHPPTYFNHVHVYKRFTPTTVLQFLVGREAVEEEQAGGGSSAEHSVAAPVLPGQ